MSKVVEWLCYLCGRKCQLGWYYCDRCLKTIDPTYDPDPNKR